MDRPTVLVVDDTPINLDVVQELLHDQCLLRTASNGKQGLEIAGATPRPDLILLDVMMPGLDGHEVCRRLKADPATCGIPVIFLTGKSDTADEELGFSLGAVDYITKPISAPILRARVQAQLRLKQGADFLRDKAAFLEQEVARRTAQVLAVQDVTTLVMASLAETRDAETSNHILRTQRYVKMLAWKLCTHPRFSATLTPRHIELLYRAAALHDIGKAGIPDRILLKPGKLSGEEFEIMKTHTTLGRDAIANAENALGVHVDFLSLAKEIAYSHQEKWDGTGYPLGVAGDAIPISGRIMAVADVYDALISRRVHKEAMSHEQAVLIIQASRGRHFDPDVVDAFLGAQDNIKSIAMAFADSGADLHRKSLYAKLAQV
ncbi:two-component system response regulator [Rubrivivax sp. A210]|uniref:response regulator n=1 Tax=Rubrivivax sp. A210 TaxID=2772301 RepID=UPI00191B8947|nr:two-component system response regulator [Rubrivivax sp. A210]